MKVIAILVSLFAVTLASELKIGEKISNINLKNSDNYKNLNIFPIEKLVEKECSVKSKKGDRLSMHYLGTLENGKKFDASYDRNRPFDFTIGSGQVIQGWEQGLLDMCIGEKRKLTIPHQLGYGERAMGPIPAKATLIFEVELLKINGRDEL